MKHKVSELTGHELDMAVALAEGWSPSVDEPSLWTQRPSGSCAMFGDPFLFFKPGVGYRPSALWVHGGPVIDRHRIATVCGTYGNGVWDAWVGPVTLGDLDADGQGSGPTALIAAMRALVASRFGEEIELPD